MKLQDQVCTYQQGVVLFNTGVSGSIFVHAVTKRGKYEGVFLSDDEGLSEVAQVIVPAFTVAELGFVLPISVLHPLHTRPGGFDGGDADDDDVCTGVWPTPKHLLLDEAAWGMRPDDTSNFDYFPTEAQARAALLIHLLESGKITADEVNNRLK